MSVLALDRFRENFIALLSAISAKEDLQWEWADKRVDVASVSAAIMVRDIRFGSDREYLADADAALVFALTRGEELEWPLCLSRAAGLVFADFTP